MRVLVDIVENLTSSIRYIVGILVLAGLAFGLMLTLGASYVAPKAAESLAEGAERVGEKAIEAAQQERVAEDMAEDGWGYGAATASAGHGSGAAQDAHPAGDGWGE